jgi:hypothetical protein
LARQASIASRAALADQLVHRQELGAPFERAADALRQHVHREGLEDVVGRQQFGRADHLAVHAFRGQHDKNGPRADDLMVAQVFQQLLAVLAGAVGAGAEVVLAQDHVVGAGGQGADGRGGADRVIDLVMFTCVSMLCTLARML